MSRQRVAAMLLMSAGALYAQDGEPLGALRHGPLVVWYLAASTRPPQSNLNAIAALHNATPLNYSEKTTGTFGQNASTYGQNAASYGVDADSPTISTPSIPADQNATTAKPNGIGYQQKDLSNFGQNAAGYGTNASNYGQNGSTAGQNAGSYGQNASSYGTAASNVGQNASDYGATNGSGAPADAASSGAAMQQQGPLRNAQAEQVKEGLRAAFPDLQMRFLAIDPDQLKARLMAARGTVDYPDVLLGTLPAAWWSGMDTEFGLGMLRPAVFYPNGVTENSEGEPEVAILMHAPHMQAARAFVLWMSEPTSGCPGCVQASLVGKEATAATVAKTAMERLLNGEPLGDAADPDLVMDSSRSVRNMLAILGSTAGNTAAPKDGARVQVAEASVNGGLAAVALRVVVSSPGSIWCGASAGGAACRKRRAVEGAPDVARSAAERTGQHASGVDGEQSADVRGAEFGSEGDRAGFAAGWTKCGADTATGVGQPRWCGAAGGGMAARRRRSVVRRTTVPGGGPQPDAADAGAGGVRQRQWPLSMESVECGRARRGGDQPLADVSADAVRRRRGDWLRDPLCSKSECRSTGCCFAVAGCAIALGKRTAHCVLRAGGGAGDLVRHCAGRDAGAGG